MDSQKNGKRKVSWATAWIALILISLSMDVILISMVVYTGNVNVEIKAERDAATFEADRCSIELMNERAAKE